MTNEEILDLRHRAKGLEMSAEVLTRMAAIPAFANLSGPDALLAAISKLNELSEAVKKAGNKA